MPPDKLARMANQIASFFRSYPAEEGAAGIKQHLVAFWTPAMLATLEAHIASGGNGVDPLVVRALHTADGPSLIDRAAAPRQAGGPMASDAG